MFKWKKKTQLHLEVHDYMLRAIVKKGESIADWVAREIPLTTGIVEEAVLLDEFALIELLKENLATLGGKNQQVSLFVPDNTVLLKKFDYAGTLDEKELKNYLNMEIGQSIHLPFQEPLVDVYDPVPDDGQAVLFAAPPEEVQKMVGILLDTDLEPSVVDVRALCNLRVLANLLLIDDEQTYLVADWSITGVSICIYSLGQIEFLRFQSIDTDLTKWALEQETEQELTYMYTGEQAEYMKLLEDQVLELDRMMNFFKFSLHKGERAVDEILVLGDNPMLRKISEILSDNLSVSVKLLTDDMIQTKFPQFSVKHSALLGLALKEGTG